MDTKERIDRIARDTLGHLSDDSEVRDEAEARIRADTVMAARLEHYEAVCVRGCGIPDAEAKQVDDDYWEQVYMPTLLKANLDVAKAMVVAAEQEIANLEA